MIPKLPYSSKKFFTLIRLKYKVALYGLATNLVLFIVAALPFFNDSPLYAQPAGENYINRLIKVAGEKQLHKERMWHLLLHYRENFLGNTTGQEDGPAFYNAPDGKTNPETELAMTLRQFFQLPETLNQGVEHPQCIFPARYKWLKKELSFDPLLLPEVRCQRLESWLINLSPEKITLVFSSFYMNNPASMFGHTLLRIDKKREEGPQKLLNYGVNYAATLDTDNALLYVFKGLFGLFKGEFALFPYYVKVQTYNNLESRDLWEYELNFTDDQMDMFLRHLWELGGNYFDYYYFQENCSYHILSLLEVANPELHLTDQFFFHVIPSDTVKALTPYSKLIANKVYRPSLLSQMAHKRTQMNDHQEALLQELIKDPSSLKSEIFQKLSTSEKALILDAFLDYAQYKNMQNKNEDKPSELIKNRAVLIERSKLGVRTEEGVQTEYSTRPELGHGSDRLKIGFGQHEGETFEEIAYRPAYHDLLAKDTGFGKGSQILFLDITARYYSDIDEFKLDRLQLIDIVSLTPYDPLFKKKSWRFAIGIDTVKDLDCNFCNSFKTSYGFGLTYKKSYFSPFTLYGLLNIELEVSNDLKRDYRAGGGGTLGLFHDFTENWRIQLLGSYLDFPLGHDSDYYKIAVNQRYAVSQNSDIRIELNQIENREEWLFSINAYF